jgi:YebC/PmpR family DNA-binding regulatory protein
MAGHSHWANIKHKKKVNDKAKAKVLARMGKLIAIACQMGPAKIEDNPRLRLAVQKARAANMNNDAIDRAIKKAAGIGANGKQMMDVTYEGYGPAGVAMVVTAATDNRARTAGEVKRILDHGGGSFGSPGCVAWQFKDTAVFLATDTDEDAVLEALLAGDADAEDIASSEDAGKVEISAAPNQYDAVLKALAAANIAVEESDLTKIPENMVNVTEAEHVEILQNLISELEDNEDVSEVFHNGVFPD